MDENKENIIVETTLPIYREAKGKYVLLGWNQVLSMHYSTRGRIKSQYMTSVLKDLNSKYTFDEPYKGEFVVEMDFYYRNTACDLGNVAGLAEKWFVDALQTGKIVANDSVVYQREIHHKVIGRDNINPRLEVRVLEKRKENK